MIRSYKYDLQVNAAYIVPLVIGLVGAVGAGMAVALLGPSPRILLVVFAVMVGVAALLWAGTGWRRWLDLCVVLLPLEGAAVLNLGFIIQLSYLCLGMAFLGLIRERWFRLDRIVSPWFLSFFVVASLSLLVTVFSPPPTFSAGESIQALPIRGIFQLLFLGLNFSAFLVFYHAAAVSRAYGQHLLRLYLLAFVASAVLGVYQVIAWRVGLPYIDPVNAFTRTFSGPIVLLYGWGKGIVRVASTFIEPLMFAYALNGVLFVLLALATASPRTSLFSRRAAMIMTGLVGVALLSTWSRSGFIGAIAGFLALLLGFAATRRLRVHVILLLLVISAVLYVGTTVAFPNVNLTDVLIRGFESAISEVFGEPELRALIPRGLSWRIAIDLFVKHPLLGVGLGNYSFYANYFRGGNISELTTFAGAVWQVISETGVLGLVTYAGCFIAYLSTLWKGLRQHRDTAHQWLMIGIFATSVAQLVHAQLYTAARLTLSTWIFMGLALAIAQYPLREMGREDR